jgi:5,10-methylenetetrahydromethanopterin reductase
MPLTFGVCVNAADSPQDFATLVRDAEVLGFDCFWIADVSLLARDAVTYLALAAVHSTRMRIGPAVFHPFVRHPAYSANAAATLDELSGGRAILGMGLGGREIVRELAYEAASLAELREWIGITRRLLAGETVSHRADRYELRDARLRFPARRPIPVYVAATGPKMLRLAGELGEGVFALVGTHPAVVALAVRQAREGASVAGREAADIGLYAYCAVAEGRDEAVNDCRRGAGVIAMRNRPYAELAGLGPAQCEAIERAATAAGSTFGKEFGTAVTDDVVSRFALAGTPADCRKLLEPLAETGITRVDIYLQGPNRLRTVRLFGTEVLPHFCG